MRFTLSLRALTALLAVAALLAPAATAQSCPDAGDTFWKNDVLADDPVGVPPEANVAIALCQTEAAGQAFVMPPGSAPQYLKQVSVGFAHTGGETTHVARFSVEIYEGSVGWNPTGNITMPPKIWDSLADEGVEYEAMSTGITSFDISEYNLIVDDDFVVVFRMTANVSFPGCPGAIPGNPANFMTDSTTSCTPGLNVFDEKFVGWVDPADWQFQPGSPICPQFFQGNFTIRACTTDAGFWTNEAFGIPGSFGLPSLVGSGPLTEGSLNPLVLGNTLPLSPTFVVIGFTQVNAPLKGGILVPAPDLFLNNVQTNAGGGWSLAAPWPGGVPSGFEIWWQVWIPDGAAILNFAASNGVKSTAP